MAYKPSDELSGLMHELLGADVSRFFEVVAQPLPHTIRFNTLKGAPDHLKSFLEEQNFQVEKFPGFDDVFRLPFQPYPVGKSLSHFLGHFYVQDIASMLPARVLEPDAGEIVLDMSAAPGSKTTQMAVMMGNRGMILANDIIQKRLRALINNLQRMGIVNTAVVKNFGESFGNRYFETFDKILLDPACSGLGTLHKNPEVLSWWTPAHCSRLAAGQRSLISSAIKALKPGGILVYSTCTLTPEENEEIIHYALQEFPVDLLPVHIPELVTHPGLTGFRRRAYDARLSQTRRLYPFENETEGFFIARLEKMEGLPGGTPGRERMFAAPAFIKHHISPVKKYLDYFSSHFNIPREYFSSMAYNVRKDITAVTPEIMDFAFRSHPLKAGMTIGRPMTQIGKLTTEGSQLLGKFASANVVELSQLEQLEDYVNRRQMTVAVPVQHQFIVSYRGLPIGYGMEEHGKFKSQFPKAEWPFRLMNT